MDIARRPFQLPNRERCQEEDTLIRLGSPLAPFRYGLRPNCRVGRADRGFRFVSS
jgi:hypothetical protein